MKNVYESPSNYFTGYYDKDVFRGGKLLVGRTENIDSLPQFGDKLEIGYIDVESNSFKKLSETTAWNWQQGCQLSFVGGHEIAFNVMEGGKVYLKKIDMQSSSESLFSAPSMAYSFDGKYYISTNVELLSSHRRSYGYAYPKELDCNSQDYIRLHRMSDGIAVRDVLSIDDVLGLINPDEDEDVTFEHCMFSPGTKRVMVLVRTRGGKQNKSILISVSLNEGTISYNQSISRVSHCCWLDDNRILGFGNIQQKVSQGLVYKVASKLIAPGMRRYIKMLLGKKPHEPMPFVGDEYFIWDVKEGKAESFGAFKELPDGHPFSILCNGRNIVVTDTYPSPESGSALLSLCIGDKGVFSICDQKDVDTDPEFAGKGYRCDLHPKISRDGRFIVVDLVSAAKRTVRIYEV